MLLDFVNFILYIRYIKKYKRRINEKLIDNDGGISADIHINHASGVAK